MNVALPQAYDQLEPAPVWSAFALLNSIPRPSGGEKTLREAICHLAQERECEFQTDERGNLVVRVPGKSCTSDAPVVALQAHLDMVCQKRPEVEIDFERDAIVPRRDGDKIFASGTTLGADNGIGVAFMIALLEGEAPAHPPLELLFTVEEETGLYGAALLDPSLVSARRLINLDSEEDDEITIGCAGGAGVMIHLPVEREEFRDGDSIFEFKVMGLAGGHSGIQIGEKLGNALKIMGQALDAFPPDLRLISFDGGTAHNAIPRDCVAVFAIAPERLGEVAETNAFITKKLEQQWREHEPTFELRLTFISDQSAEIEAKTQPMTEQATQTVLRLVRELPHGVQAMSARWEGKVQTSSNLAQIETSANEVEFGISNRSFLAGDIAQMQELCATVGKNAGARVEERDGYPGWEPRAHSPPTRPVRRRFRQRERAFAAHRSCSRRFGMWATQREITRFGCRFVWPDDSRRAHARRMGFNCERRAQLGDFEGTAWCVGAIDVCRDGLHTFLLGFNAKTLQPADANRRAEVFEMGN